MLLFIKINSLKHCMFFQEELSLTVLNLTLKGDVDIDGRQDDRTDNQQ